MKSIGHLFLRQEHLLPSEERELFSSGWQFVLVEHHQALWLASSTALDLQPGNMLLVFPQHRGRLRASQLGPVQLQTFNFHPELLAGLLTLWERHQLEECMGRTSSQPRLLSATHPYARQFARLVQEVSEKNSLLHRCRVLELAAAVLMEEILAPPPCASRSASAPERFRSLVAQMTDSEWLQYTARDLAAMCGCSSRHFIHLFHQHFGTSLRISRQDGALKLPLVRKPRRGEDRMKGPEERIGRLTPSISLQKSNGDAIRLSRSRIKVASMQRARQTDNNHQTLM